MPELKYKRILLKVSGEALSGPQGDKLRDIGLIYAAYEALAAEGRADPRTRLDRLASCRSCSA